MHAQRGNKQKKKTQTWAVQNAAGGITRKPSAKRRGIVAERRKASTLLLLILPFFFYFFLVFVEGRQGMGGGATLTAAWPRCGCSGFFFFGFFFFFFSTSAGQSPHFYWEIAHVSFGWTAMGSSLNGKEKKKKKKGADYLRGEIGTVVLLASFLVFEFV